MNGMPLFIPNSLRSNAIVPVTSPWPVPLPARFKFNVFGFETPRIVNVPGTSGSRPGLDNFRGVERDVRVLFHIEKIFAFELTVL